MVIHVNQLSSDIHDTDRTIEGYFMIEDIPIEFVCFVDIKEDEITLLTQDCPSSNFHIVLATHTYTPFDAAGL
jgi:hypothetical protein